jgi:peptidoglycan/xylan/chitin deacetylase (PgdA/CDA1 family)
MDTITSDIMFDSCVQPKKSRLSGILRKARREAIAWLVRSGFLRLRRALSGRNHVILTFHRMRPDGLGLDSYDTCPSMSATLFREILEYVAVSFVVVSLRDLAQRRREAAPAAAITFDDGWRDNFDVAFPILRELRLPATIFVTTGKLGSSRPFWQQMLGTLFRNATDGQSHKAKECLQRMLEPGDDTALTPSLYRRTVKRWKNDPQSTPEDRILNAGWQPSQDSEPTRCFLSAEEIREMRKSGIDFGSHTVTHALLPDLEAATMLSELSESKSVLEGIIGEDVDMLAYPNGEHSDEVVRCARSVGYRIGCTTRNMRIAAHDDRLLLPRVEPEWDFAGHAATFNEDMFRWNTK